MGSRYCTFASEGTVPELDSGFVVHLGLFGGEWRSVVVTEMCLWGEISHLRMLMMHVFKYHCRTSIKGDLEHVLGARETIGQDLSIGQAKALMNENNRCFDRNAISSRRSRSWNDWTVPNKYTERDNTIKNYICHNMGAVPVCSCPSAKRLYEQGYVSPLSDDHFWSTGSNFHCAKCPIIGHFFS